MIQRISRDTTANMPPLMKALFHDGGTLGDLKGLIGEMRAATPLPEDAQRVIDNAVVKIGLERLVVVQDLLSEGLTYPLTNAMSVMEVQWEAISKTGGAQRTMSPRARGEYQLPDRTPQRIPIYLTTDDFSLGIRLLLASQRVGSPLDTTLAMEATRRVNEAIEDAAINGAGVVVNGQDTPGILTHDNINTYQYTGGEAWDAAGKTGAEIVTDVLAMVGQLQAAQKYGPYNLYLNTLYGNALNRNWSDGTTTFPITIAQRLEQIMAGGRPIRIRIADMLPTNKIVLMQMTSDTIDLINGQAPTVVPWTSPDGFTLYWIVMAIQVPRVRADYDGNSGIVVGNTV